MKVEEEGTRTDSSVVKEEGCRIEEVCSGDDDVQGLGGSIKASSGSHEHLLQEDKSRTATDLQGRAIASSTSFPLKGDNLLKTTKSNLQNFQTTEQHKNNSDISISLDKSSFEHNLKGTQRSPNNTNSNHHTPGKHNQTTELAAHNGQGVT